MNAWHWINYRAPGLIVGIALVSGVLYTAQVIEARDAAQCQAQYNEAFTKQITERSRLTSAQTAAVDDLLLGISAALIQPTTLDPKVQAKRRESFLQLFANYRGASEAVAAEKAANPYPPFPEC